MATRGFGNFQYKNNKLINIEEQEISPIPNIFEIENEQIKYLIICNSGFFEIAEIANNVNKSIEKKIADFFVNKLKTQKKISDIIGEYIDEFIPKNKESMTNPFEYNLSCIIIDFINN